MSSAPGLALCRVRRSPAAVFPPLLLLKVNAVLWPAMLKEESLANQAVSPLALGVRVGSGATPLPGSTPLPWTRPTFIVVSALSQRFSSSWAPFPLCLQQGDDGESSCVSFVSRVSCLLSPSSFPAPTQDRTEQLSPTTPATEVQKALALGLQVIGFNALPIVSARNYGGGPGPRKVLAAVELLIQRRWLSGGCVWRWVCPQVMGPSGQAVGHRGTLNWALQCEFGAGGGQGGHTAALR